MVRRSFRIGLRLGLLAGLGYAIVRTVRARRDDAPAPAWDPPVAAPPVAAPRAPAPPPPPAPVAPVAPVDIVEIDDAGEADVGLVPEPDDLLPAGRPERPLRAARSAPATKKKAAAPAVAWVEANGGACPTTHPVKAKLASKIFHVPGGLNYSRTKADRCYRDAESAAADGLRQSQR